MFPLLAMHYLVNALSVSAKSIRKVYLALSGGVAPSDFQDLFISKKSHTVIRAYHWFEAAFLHLVVYVILIRAKKQVLRIYAGWCIATVQHLHASGYRTLKKNPRYTVNEYFVRERARSYRPVFFPDSCAQPDPASAFGYSLNAAQDSFFKRHKSGHLNLLCNRKITLKHGE